MADEEDAEKTRRKPRFRMSFVSTGGNPKHRRELKRRLRELEAEGKA